MAKVHVHFLGIGGSGASAAAAIANSQGFEVSGCDLNPNNEFTLHIGCVTLKGHSSDHLNQKNYKIPNVPIQIHTRSVHSNIKNTDILAITPAIYSLDPNNPELLEAEKKKIPIMTWQEFLGKYLTKDNFVIAVAGTHGKTTTTAMIAKMLEDAGKDPTVALGAIVPWWGTNYRIPTRHPERSEGSLTNVRPAFVGDSSAAPQNDKKLDYFVVEADEYNDNFLSITPDISVVTNIEMDHPEYFKDFDAYKKSFKKFLLQTKSTIIANLSDSVVAQILKDLMKQSTVTCFDYSNNQYKLDLKIPGNFNNLNAKAAFQVGLLLRIDPSIIRKSLENYTGVGRRFEYLGSYKGREVYSDFGHHPTEIKITMQAARQKFPKSRIWLVYQPHMFSRTKALFDDFVKVFQQLPVDKIIITDIYHSREPDTGLVSSKQLVDAVSRHPEVVYLPKEELASKLANELRENDIIFFMGAGDIDKFARDFIES